MGNSYTITIKEQNKAIRTPKESTEILKGVIGAKRIAKMKKEAIECPVLEKTVSFVECYSCSNFIRRVRGTVHCKGEPLDK